ncbi:hypothetical protein C8R44DRAFT_887950 [Mycena epipterygia]|nr:hypothetical protein C8R44DRAFT_887950 [Mycena epipterygia]
MPRLLLLPFPLSSLPPHPMPLQHPSFAATAPAPVVVAAPRFFCPAARSRCHRSAPPVAATATSTPVIIHAPAPILVTPAFVVANGVNPPALLQSIPRRKCVLGQSIGAKHRRRILHCHQNSASRCTRSNAECRGPDPHTVIAYCESAEIASWFITAFNARVTPCPRPQMCKGSSCQFSSSSSSALPFAHSTPLIHDKTYAISTPHSSLPHTYITTLLSCRLPPVVV